MRWSASGCAAACWVVLISCSGSPGDDVAGEGGQSGAGAGGVAGAAGSSGAGGASGASGASGQGGSTPCVPVTCDDLGASCGPIPDGCGLTLDCGTCEAGTVCGPTHQCLGTGGVWQVTATHCDQQSVLEPGTVRTWQLTSNVLQLSSSDADCSVLELGTWYTFDWSFQATLSSKSCSPEGCVLGQDAPCQTSAYSPILVLKGSFELPSFTELSLLFPGGTATPCPVGTTVTLDLERVLNP